MYDSNAPGFTVIVIIPNGGNGPQRNWEYSQFSSTAQDAEDSVRHMIQKREANGEHAEAWVAAVIPGYLEADDTARYADNPARLPGYAPPWVDDNGEPMDFVPYPTMDRWREICIRLQLGEKPKRGLFGLRR
jgi:hypothetical protein